MEIPEHVIEKNLTSYVKSLYEKYGDGVHFSDFYADFYSIDRQDQIYMREKKHKQFEKDRKL